MRKTKLITICMALMVLLYTSCSEKEVPTPVVDNARVDALREELRQLQILVYGEALENAALKADEADLEDLIADLEAAITALETTYAQAVTYQVQAFDFQGKVIPGASVTVNQNGTITTVVAGTDGVARFENVRAGAVVGVVSATGFATANYVATLYNADEFGSTTRVPLIPKGGTAQSDAGMFTLSGYVYANFNAVDDTTNTLGGASNNWVGYLGPITSGKTKNPAFLYAGANPDFPHRTYEKVTKTFSATLYLDDYYVPFSVETEGDGNARIRRIAYEDAIFTATYDANKKYSIKLPAYSDFMAGFIDWDSDETTWYWRFTFEEFVADVTLIDYTTKPTYNDLVYDSYQNGYVYWKVLADTKAVVNPGVLKTFTRKYEFRYNSDLYDNDTYMDTWWFSNNDQQVQPGQVVQYEWTNFFYEPFKNY